MHTPHRKLTTRTLCEFEGCTLKATEIVYDRRRGKGIIMLCCEVHAETVMGYGTPEYTMNCQNCGCGHGIN